MNPSPSFIDKLRGAGVVLRMNGDRLLVQAPAGVVTAELREEIVRRKPELISAIQGSSSKTPAEPDSLREIANLLTAAYQRYVAIPKPHAEQRIESAPAGVALFGTTSVHGGGQPNEE